MKIKSKVILGILIFVVVYSFIIADFYHYRPIRRQEGAKNCQENICAGNINSRYDYKTKECHCFVEGSETNNDLIKWFN